MSDSLLALLADIWPFIVVGFGAQIVDGALGMAYGVISSTLLLALGVPPSAASAGVHAAETFTSGASGISHILHRNVDWNLLGRLLVPGIIGGVAGAYVLSNIDGNLIKPFIQAYLVAIGILLLWRGFRYPPAARPPRHVVPLGLVGGFLDASGGGGWGPIVTSNLLVQGASPRYTIGTVNTAEFGLSLAISLTFLLHLGWETLTTATLGLLIGGVAAAPFGAILARRIPAKLLLIGVGFILLATSLFGIGRSLGIIA